MEKEVIYFEITPIQPHVIQQRETRPLSAKLLKSLRSRKEVRWHDSTQPLAGTQRTINLGTSLLELQQELEKKTGKIVRFMISKKGLGIRPSPDIMEKIQAIKKKRLQSTRVWRDEE